MYNRECGSLNSILSHRAIARKTEIARTTVQRVIQQKLKADSRSGRPITLNFRDKRRLRLKSLCHIKRNYSSILAEYFSKYGVQQVGF